MRGPVISQAVRFRHDSAAYTLLMINKFTEDDDEIFLDRARQYLNPFNDPTLNDIGNRILSMLTALHVNMAPHSSICVFLLPYAIGMPQPDEVLYNSAGVVNWSVDYTHESSEVCAMLFDSHDGQDNDEMPMFDYAEFPYRPGGRNFQLARLPQVAAVAESTFTNDNIIAFRRPPTRSFPTTTLVPMLREYMSQACLRSIRAFSVRSTSDNPHVHGRNIIDRLSLSVGTVGARDGDDALLAAAFGRSESWYYVSREI